MCLIGKLHLAGAEWGAWTVDKNAEFHGGNKTPSPKPIAPRVEEVVKYTDTDKNGFLDTIEYDYDGDRTIDLRVSLLDYRTAQNPHPDVVALVDTHKQGLEGIESSCSRRLRTNRFRRRWWSIGRRGGAG